VFLFNFQIKNTTIMGHNLLENRVLVLHFIF
jgi:hypothetical protein